MDQSVAPSKAERRAARWHTFQINYNLWDGAITWAFVAFGIVITIEMCLMGIFDWDTRTRVTVGGLTTSFTLMFYGLAGLRIKCRWYWKLPLLVLLTLPCVVQFVAVCYYLVFLWPAGY